MGKEWDKLARPKPGNIGGFADGNKPSFERVKRHLPAMQEWHYQWATAALRVAKPGCHLLAFGGTRTFHRLACAIEDAGWEIRDTLMWVYGSGFPKSHDVSKAIDKAAGARRGIIGEYRMPADSTAPGYRPSQGLGYGSNLEASIGRPITAPATDAARQWEGWGTALKPAWEPIILARKPLEGTVAENVQKWGTGAINVDGCRVSGEKGVPAQNGRWPANLIHDGSEEVLSLFPCSSDGVASGKSRGFASDGYVGGSGSNYNGEPIGYGGSGSAARFFKCCPLDNECILCYNPSCKDTTTEEICKHISAHHAEKSLTTIRETIRFIVQDIALTGHVKRLAQNVLFAESLCASCGTNIALALVGIKRSGFKDEELQVILDSIGNFKSSILIQNLVSFAGLWENIDTIPTTKSLSILFGSVNHAITNSTRETEKTGAKRFIYTPKASRAEREAGLEGMADKTKRIFNGGIPSAVNSDPRGMSGGGDRPAKNHHPTVKPVALMRYLCRLVTPPGGLVLDPFMGSGSTGIAARLESFRFIGIEKDAEYFEIAKRRIGSIAIPLFMPLD